VTGEIRSGHQVSARRNAPESRTVNCQIGSQLVVLCEASATLPESSVVIIIIIIIIITDASVV
jgi:hypothetical protein